MSSSVRQALTNVAVVGTGRMGLLRIGAIQANVRSRLPYIVTEFQQDVDLLNETYGESTLVVNDLDLVLNDPKVDAVWLSTPTSTHLELIERIACAKKHIAVEKPVASELNEIRAAFDVASKNNVKLFCSYQRRFDPSYLNLQQKVQNGTIGSIQSIIAIFRDHPMPPIEFLKDGGDPFHDLAVHDIDYICNLLREYPETLVASGFSLDPELKNANVMDKAAVWLHFPSGIVSFIDLSRGSSYGYDQRIEVFGQNGMLQVANQPSTSMIASTETGVQHDVYVHSFPQRFSTAYGNEVEHFVDIIQNNQPPLVTKEQAVMSTIIAEAARLSAESHRPVRLVSNNNEDVTDIRYQFE